MLHYWILSKGHISSIQDTRLDLPLLLCGRASRRELLDELGRFTGASLKQHVRGLEFMNLDIGQPRNKHIR